MVREVVAEGGDWEPQLHPECTTKGNNGTFIARTSSKESDTDSSPLCAPERRTPGRCSSALEQTYLQGEICQVIFENVGI